MRMVIGNGLGILRSLLDRIQSVKFDGRWIQLLNPAAVPPTRHGNKALDTYWFNSSEMVAVASILYNKLQNDTDGLLSIGWTTSFPYRTWKGKTNKLHTSKPTANNCIRQSLLYL